MKTKLGTKALVVGTALFTGVAHAQSSGQLYGLLDAFGENTNEFQKGLNVMVESTGHSPVYRSSWALSYDYPLSTRTDVYVAVLSDRASRMSSGTTAGGGNLRAMHG